MLHCNSTSLGYMKPSTPGIIVRSLSHRAVQVFVVDLGFGSHLRFQDRYLVLAQEFVDRVLRILEIDQLPRRGGAILAARGGQPLGDAVITQRALVRGAGFRMQVTAAVRACLNAVPAAEAVVLVDQNHAIGADEGRADRADLHARGIGAMVAEFGHEETLEPGLLRRRETVEGAVRGGDVRGAVALGDFVTLDPGAVVALGDAVFIGAGLHAVSAADALVDVDDHAPPVVGHPVDLGGGFGAGDLRQGGAGAGEDQQLASGLQHLASGDIHRPPQRCGLCGLWQVLHTIPPECSAETTCGKLLGLAVFFSWQRTQSVATSGSFGIRAPASSACLASGPWQASQATWACLPSARTFAWSSWQSAHCCWPA